MSSEIHVLLQVFKNFVLDIYIYEFMGMPVSHKCPWYPKRSEEVIRSLGIGVIDSIGVACE